MSKNVVVVPTIREAQIKQFLSEWNNQFKFDGSTSVIVVEDNPEKTFDIKSKDSFIRHYSWQDIEKDLGEASWIIPRRTDCIRSYGYWKAQQLHPDMEMLITLDDDCYPHVTETARLMGNTRGEDIISGHAKNLVSVAKLERWQSTLGGVTPRGIPYENRKDSLPCVISHGLWAEVPDFDAITQLVQTRQKDSWYANTGHIRKHFYFPMCGMNVAIKSEVIPMFYFLLMGQNAKGEKHPYDRFGDIWCGIILKKICDHLGFSVYSGDPCIRHTRASNVWTNLDKEHEGMKMNEHFWKMIDEISLRQGNIKECYKEIANSMWKGHSPYFNSLSIAMLTWADLF